MTIKGEMQKCIMISAPEPATSGNSCPLCPDHNDGGSLPPENPNGNQEGGNPNDGTIFPSYATSPRRGKEAPCQMTPLTPISCPLPWDSSHIRHGKSPMLMMSDCHAVPSSPPSTNRSSANVPSRQHQDGRAEHMTERQKRMCDVTDV